MKIKLSEILQDTKTVAISGHIRPDGDCVGSCIGLYLYIQQEFPDVQPTVYLEETVILLSFWKEATRIIHSCEEEKVYDLSLHWMPGTSSVSERLQNILTLQNARSALTTISATQAMHRAIISKQRQVLPVN